MLTIHEGFKGQRLIILPFYIVDWMDKNELTSELLIHSLGHYPNAKYHSYERPNGAEEYILIYCVKGKGWYTINDKKYTVKEDQLFILPPRVTHSYGACSKDPWSIYWTHFKGKIAGYFASGFEKPTDVSISGNSRKSESIEFFDEIYNTLEKGFDEDRLIYSSICLRYFLGTFKFLNSTKQKVINNGFGRNIIHLATHFMNENIEKSLTLNDISAYFGYSTSYFHRLFYNSVGYAPMQYFIQLKIRRACYLLVNTSYKICQVALMVGFDDQYYFSRIFSKHVNKSPSEYRKENSKGIQ